LQTAGKGIVKTCTETRKGKELNKNIGSKSLHHFVQRLLMPSVRQQVAKPQVLMRSQQNCSKQERRYWTECTEYVWRSGKSVSGHRNGRSPHSSHFPRKVILILKQCANYRTIALVSHASKILLRIILERIQVKTETEIADEQGRDSNKEGGQEIKPQISEYSCTRQASTNNHSICASWTSRRRSTLSPMINSG